MERAIFNSSNDNDTTRDSVSVPASETGSSLISGLSLLDNDTAENNENDTFDRRLLEDARQRDRKRLRDAVSSQQNHVVAFRMAKPSASLGTIIGGLARNVDGSPNEKLANLIGLGATDQVPGVDNASISSSERSISPNLPAQWGRKGKQRNEFLRRIPAARSDHTKADEVHTQGQEDGKKDGSESDTIYRRRTIFTGDSPRSDVDWNDVGLQSIEAESPSRRRRNWDSRYSKKDLHLSHLDDEINEKTQDGRLENEQMEQDGVGGPLVVVKGSKSSRRISEDDRMVEGRSRQQVQRQDSRDLLRQLARATSKSPTGTPTEGRVASSDQNLFEYANHHVETFEQNDYKDESKTPVVTGAWVETPATQKILKVVEREQASTIRAEKFNRKPVVPRKDSSHPKSALEAVLQGSGHEKSAESNFGDSTFNSLKEMLEDTGAQHDDFPVSADLDEDTLNLINNVNTPLTNSKEQREEEYLTLQRMNNRLRAARIGIRDANRGIKRVEDTFDKQYESRTGQSYCPSCGSLHTVPNTTLFTVLWNTWSTIMTGFYLWPKGAKLRLTWLGVATLIFVIWGVSELTLCDIYCHKFYASSMIGFGVDIHAPRMPWVTITIISRQFRWLYEPLWNIIAWCTQILWGMVYLLWRGIEVKDDNAGVRTQNLPFEYGRNHVFEEDEYLR